MNAKQAKKLRKVALGFAAVQAESGKQMSAQDVKFLYKKMKKATENGVTDLSRPQPNTTPSI